MVWRFRIPSRPSFCQAWPRIKKKEAYVRTLADHLHPVLQTLFLDERPVLQGYNWAFQTTKIGQDWPNEHEVQYVD